MSVQAILQAAQQKLAEKQYTEAETLFRKVLRESPSSLAASGGLARLLHVTKRHQEALPLAKKLVQKEPRHREYRILLADLFFALGQAQEAANAFRAALGLDAKNVHCWQQLGKLYQHTGQLTEAVECYAKAVQQQAELASAWNNMGVALRGLGMLEDALSCFRRAVSSAPDDVELLANLAGALKEEGLVEESLVHYRHALEKSPGHAAIFSNYLFAMQYAESLGSEEIFAEHRRFGEHWVAPPSSQPRSATGGRPLRVGYVSPDFREHSVASFAAPILARHNPLEVESYLYEDVARPDVVTERFRGLCEGRVRRIAGLGDDEVVAMVQEDQLDVLVDLAGHTAFNRMTLFARQAAPVQITWIGYPDTTGLSSMQYRVTDVVADPVGAESRHSERLLRLPGCFLCYEPPQSAPEVGALPMLSRAAVTFGCFGVIPKLSAGTVAVWSRILQALPGSRLLLKVRGGANRETQEKLRARFVGVSPEQIEIRPQTPDRAGHLAIYQEVDIALDTWPYNGTTTLCEALWMGVPVVSLAGERHVSRVGASLLTALGHPEWVAWSEEEYVEKALALAGDVEALAKRRSSLRAELVASVLCDAEGRTRAWEAALRACVRV